MSHLQLSSLTQLSDYLQDFDVDDYDDVVSVLPDTIFLQDAKIKLSLTKISIYFIRIRANDNNNSDNSYYDGEDIICCQINNVYGRWYIELGSYATNKEMYNLSPILLSSGTKTVYLLSALCCILRIPELLCLDSAIIPNTDIELSIIKMTLDQPSFYEKFGYQPLHLDRFQRVRSSLRQFASQHEEFYVCCFQYIKHHIPFTLEDLPYDNQLEDIISSYHDYSTDNMVKTISGLDLLYWQLEYEHDYEH